MVSNHTGSHPPSPTRLVHGYRAPATTQLQQQNQTLSPEEARLYTQGTWVFLPLFCRTMDFLSPGFIPQLLKMQFLLPGRETHVLGLMERASISEHCVCVPDGKLENRQQARTLKSPPWGSEFGGVNDELRRQKSCWK